MEEEKNNFFEEEKEDEEKEDEEKEDEEKKDEEKKDEEKPIEKVKEEPSSYCKICGGTFKSRLAVLAHVRAKHNMKTAEYDSITNVIPNAAMQVWNRNKKLQKMFPVPGDFSKGFKHFKNFMSWVRTRGVKHFPGIRREVSEMKKQGE